MEADYKVQLDVFEGPLDLLLYLIKKDEIDIYEISLERITKQYLAYLNTFKLLNIELASEFIVMAANLMYIKSRTLLPKHVQPPEDEEDEEDPRWELIRQLIEYKKFKDAAGFLRQRAEEEARAFPPIPEWPESGTDEPDPLPEVGIFDLIRAFQKVLRRFEEEEVFGEILDDRFTVGDQIDRLMRATLAGDRLAFSSLFQDAHSRSEVIVTFLALLELMKLNEFRIEQDQAFGEILLIRRERESLV
ncbi:MAG: segregation/condensation protein A [Verrucomicrobiota bacterium]